jgi:hypothetical protein
MKRILCSLLVATLPFGSVLAETPKAKNAKVTLVYQHRTINPYAARTNTGTTTFRSRISIYRKRSRMYVGRLECRPCW